MESSEKKIPVSNTESPPPPPPPSPAPPEGNVTNRSSLVELAVKFLNNPRVVDKPMEEKKAFLRKKGMNLMVMVVTALPSFLPVRSDRGRNQHSHQ